MLVCLNYGQSFSMDVVRTLPSSGISNWNRLLTEPEVRARNQCRNNYWKLDETEPWSGDIREGTSTGEKRGSVAGNPQRIGNATRPTRSPHILSHKVHSVTVPRDAQYVEGQERDFWYTRTWAKDGRVVHFAKLPPPIILWMIASRCFDVKHSPIGNRSIWGTGMGFLEDSSH